MKDETNSISTAPLEHASQDFERLRQQGVEHVQRFAGTTWTDHNAHDPGITILEQVCFALTDFGYRCGLPMADMVLPSDYAKGSLRGPLTMLSCDPVTESDLRKVALDVPGVLNAWVEPLHDDSVSLWFDSGSGEVRLGDSQEGGLADPLNVRGRYRVVVQPASEDQVVALRRVIDIRRAVTERMHACRGLGTDFDGVDVLEWQDVRVAADLEVGAIDNLDALLKRIQEALAEFIEPPVRRTAPETALLSGRPSELVFEGPALTQGMIDDEALAHAPRRRAIRVSDLVRVLMDVPEVRAVRDLMLSTSPIDSVGATMLYWELPLRPEQVARFDPRNSRIRLTRGRLSQAARPKPDLMPRMMAMEAVKSVQTAPVQLDGPRGRFRLGSPYVSVQRQFPEIYGVGEFGLEEKAPPSRKAQARQLQAYMLVFDQVMATYFSQLQSAHALFAVEGPQLQTYFPEPVQDDVLKFDEVRDAEARSPQWLLDQIETKTEAYERRNRFLDHLLARFAEDLSDLSLEMFARRQNDAEVYTDLAQHKKAFLRDYPRISGARGTGAHGLRDADDARGAYDLPARRSGLEERVRLALGRPADDPGFIVVEHILLRPVPEDDVEDAEATRRPPILIARTLSEPYSLRITFALSRSLLADTTEELVNRVARAETPAHIKPELVWLDGPRWTVFVRSHAAWRKSLVQYRKERLEGAVASYTHVLMRLWRDAVIEQLEIGQTPPLRDVAIIQQDIRVTFGSPAVIPLAPTQPGIRYVLLKDGEPVPAGPSAPNEFAHVEGNGGEAALSTPPITDTTTFRILAINTATSREVILRDSVRVEVGFDERIPIRVVQGRWLNPLDENPNLDSPRLIDYGTAVDVEVLRSQESVDYHVTATAPGGTLDRGQIVSVEPKRGLRGKITLTTVPLTEDVDLWVVATRAFESSESLPLKTVLPVKVRASRETTLTAQPLIVDRKGRGQIELVDSLPGFVYRAWTRRLTDDDFPFSQPPSPENVFVQVPDEPEALEVVRPDPVRLAAQLRLESATGPDAGTTRYSPLPEVQSNGGALTLDVPNVQADTIVVVEARKRHIPGIGGDSAVLLNEPSVFLVRPNPEPGLMATAFVSVAQDARIELRGGQMGVLYGLRRDGETPRDAYFHRYEGQSNVGVGRLRVDRDLAVTRSRVDDPSVNFGSTPPLSPSIDIDGSPSGGWRVQARWARSRVAIELPTDLVVPDIPQFELTEAAGDLAVRILGSRPDHVYRLRVAEQIRAEQSGTGEDLTLVGDDVGADARAELLVEAPTLSAIPAELVIELTRARPADG